MHRTRVMRWLVVLATLAVASTTVDAQDHNRAGVVIRRADGRTATYCVRFGEPSITGLELLTRAGLSVQAEVSGLGTAVCSIDGEGCAYPAQPCFCRCQGAECAYWNYFHLIDGAWRYSPISASGYTIVDGAIDGWAWGDQDAPPVFTIDQICSEPAATAVETSPTPRPTPAPIDATDTHTPAAVQPVAAAPPSDTPVPATSLAFATATPAATISSPLAAVSPLQSPAAESDNGLETGSPAPDPAAYSVFGLIVVVLGGWLIVNRARRR